MCLPPRQTDRFARAVAHARSEATALAAPALGTEHLLLGLVREEAESGGDVLSGIAPADLRALLPRAHPAPHEHPPPLTRRARAALHTARRLADGRGDRGIGVGHLLAGVLGDPDGAGVAALERLGVDVGDRWSRAVAEIDRRPPLAVLAMAAGPRPVR